MQVTHPGLGGYDRLEQRMHNDAIGGYRDDPAEHGTVKSPEKARSGIISGHVLAVLVASTTLAIIALCVVLAVTV